MEISEIFKELKIETKTTSIDSLFSIRMSSRINYSPSYQRNYVWNTEKATYFIESILIGTEIPPLIFFKVGNQIEVIDGRQRYETIKNFIDGKFYLNKDGLKSLEYLEKKKYQTFDSDLIEIFRDTKLRIIEFSLVKELSEENKDRVKKEIFRRYNSGITPLKESEVEDAHYDSDLLSKYIKKNLKDENLLKRIYFIFFKDSVRSNKEIPIDKLLSFIRKNLILQYYCIRYYASNGNREKTIELLYKRYYSNITENDAKDIFESFIEKIKIIEKIKNKLNLDEENFLVYECLLWFLYIIEKENISMPDLDVISKHIEIGLEENKIALEASYRSKPILERYGYILLLLKNISNYDELKEIYIDDRNIFKQNLEIIQNEVQEKIENKNIELDNLKKNRINKPEPSKKSIDDLLRELDTNKMIIRPSYQRKEVMDKKKSYALIESLLLGVPLPPLFFYKKNNKKIEVIDGQQRLLAILGFLGKGYLDTDGEKILTKKDNMTLKKLDILFEYNNKKFTDLSFEDQDRILDSELFIVEISEELNPNFDPIDLFIRLNEKPYPIKENSFENWNSIAHNDITNLIKKLTQSSKEWFYIRNTKNPNSIDRMQNEELLTILTFIHYSKEYFNIDIIDKYTKENNIQIRLKNKDQLTSLLRQSEKDIKITENFKNSLKETKNFVEKIKLILLDKNIENIIELEEYLDSELNLLFNLIIRKGVKRTLKNFYLLWGCLEDIPLAMVKEYRHSLKGELKKIFSILNENSASNDKLYYLDKEINRLKEKYKIEKRKIRLNKIEVLEKLKEQNNKCSLSGTPLYLGDSINIDHIIPISKGGKDTKENLQITHEIENKKKGNKM